MKQLIISTACFVLCFACTAFAQVFPVENILVNGLNSKRINLVYLADGYQIAQLDNFVTQATTVNASLFTQTPFLEYKNFFNAYAIKVPSTQSGAKHPGTATDVTEPASPVINPSNYFNSSFDVGSIHRLLVPANGAQVAAVAFSNVPEYDQLLLLVNDAEYGGSGGFVATSSVHNSANEIMYHEIGHSFANLGDEYWFNCAERKNRTANNDPLTNIWKNWLNTNGVGIYAMGASGASSNCYRPHQGCKMQYLGLPFCSVCKEAFIDRIYQLVSPIDAFLPASNNVVFAGPSMDFELTLILPNPNTLQIEWLLNGNTIATSGTSVSLMEAQLSPGSNTLQARVTDATLLSRAYWPGSSGYLHSVTWTIESALPVELLDFQVRLLNEQAVLDWKTATEKASAYFEVQKSSDGLDFEPIAKMDAAGNSSSERQYRLIDPSPGNGATYYRLKHVDMNGAFEYSPVRSIYRIDKIRYEVFPNPADDVLQVRVQTQNSDSFVLQIFDMQGRQVFGQSYEPAEALSVDIPVRSLPSGQYSLHIATGMNHITKSFEKL
ncbi:MAG: T9SS type A sorting domain-containing protein [Saprospiraceae bacterium]|nr:T9SS type A sorting domain-containing protein [Saprospiraceae bacterium]